MHEKTASVADYFSAVYHCEDLGDIRIFPSSDEMCRAFGAKALTVGSDIHFRDGEFAPRTRRGFWLLAHEVAHVVQQRRGPVTSGSVKDGMAVGPHDAPEEAEASAAADAALAGGPFEFAPPAPGGPQGLPEGGTGGRVSPRQGDSKRGQSPLWVVQRYMAWEHLMLGTAGQDEARDIVREANGTAGGSPLAAYCQLMTSLGLDPENADPVKASAGGVPAVRLPGSGVVVTLGEISILPDYLSRPEDIERAPKKFVLPLVQSTRAWNIREMGSIVHGPAQSKRATKRLKLQSTMAYPSLGGLAELAEGIQVTALGRRCGFPAWERYQSVVSRNACHFAPFAWYRWQDYHLKAREYALAAYQSRDSDQRTALTTKAWINAGYADHFLQDSFAAGHLINKTLVMQWYADLLIKSRLPVPERRHLAAVSYTAQPGLHGPGYYRPVSDERNPDRLVPSPTPGAPGVTDPQATAEAATLEERVAASGVVGQDPAERMAAYSSYLKLLRSSVVQSVSGTIHDYLNEKSLVVAAGADGEPFRMYGDWSMLQGEDSAGRAGAAGELSRQAIADLLAAGETPISSRKIFEMFPDHVEHDGTMVPLEEWHSSRLLDWCHADFFTGRSARILRAATTIAFRHLGVPSCDLWRRRRVGPLRQSGALTS